jgi:carbonic anhydrase
MFDPTHPTALAVYCSDGRFTRAIEEHLAELGHARLDTLTIPGGPAHLNLSTARPADRDTVGRAVSFLIQAHHIRDVVLFAHEGCGYYKDRYAGHSADAIEALQRQDLRDAMRQLALTDGKLRITAFVAQVAGGEVMFETVE